MFYALECTSRKRALDKALLLLSQLVDVSMLKSTHEKDEEEPSLSSNMSLPAAPGRFLPAKQNGEND
jgi:hypothetical protein